MVSKSVEQLEIMTRILAIVFSATLFCTCISSTDKVERPNFILFIADDMNWDDCGAYGHPTIRTPQIDKLASEGMLFTNAFLTTSSCSPSRLSILTGLYPHSTDAEQLHWPLPEGRSTFVELLKQSGYWTGLAGKYHLGDAVRDHFSEIMEVGTAGFQLGSDGKQQKMQGDGSGCESWLDLLNARPADQPFFLWLAAVDPHRPYVSDIIENPHQIDDVIVPPYLPDNDEVRQDLAMYYDEISRMDNYVGNVLKEIDRQGIDENTMILFFSDNGRPFPRDKTTLYDGGIKTPFIISWPGVAKSGTKVAHMVSTIDIAPTILDLAGIHPSNQMNGLSFVSILKNPNVEIRSEIYAEDHWHDFEDYTRAVRTKEFKYIRNFYPDLPNTPPADAFRSMTYQSMLKQKEADQLNESQSRCFEIPRPEEELYDIINDPNELINLADTPEYAKQLTDMRNRLEHYRSTTNDYIPEYRTPDDFDRITGLPTIHRVRPRPSKAEMERNRSATVNE